MCVKLLKVVLFLEAHPSCQTQGNVALLPSINNLHLIVVAAGGEWLTSLGQTYVHDALSFANILQELRKMGKKQEWE